MYQKLVQPPYQNLVHKKINKKNKEEETRAGARTHAHAPAHTRTREAANEQQPPWEHEDWDWGQMDSPLESHDPTAADAAGGASDQPTTERELLTHVFDQAEADRQADAALDALTTNPVPHPDHCSEHAYTDDPGPCHACKDARLAYEASTTAAAQAQARHERERRANRQRCRTCDLSLIHI